jgi:poly(3-hydroxybutyrate) depolymerase
MGPTIVFHSDRDKTVHPRNGEQVLLRSVEQNGASRADASTERGRVPGGHAYTRTVHCDSTGRVVLEHWLVHEGGHAWFGGSPRGSYVDPKNLLLSEGRATSDVDLMVPREHLGRAEAELRIGGLGIRARWIHTTSATIVNGSTS